MFRKKQNTFGFEIEIENTTRRRLFPLAEKDYKIVLDGSLRNGGVEVVSPPFLGISKTKLEYYKVLQFLKSRGSFSYRCGVHVHVGTFKLEDVEKLIRAYLPYERDFFEIFPNRKGNNFCIPVLDTDEDALLLGSLVLTPKAHIAEDLCENWGKYSAMNIKPILSQGTVEFRVASGSFDHRKVFKMFDLIESVLDTFYGREPKIKPKEENLLEANEYLEMCKRVAKEVHKVYDYSSVSFKKEAERLLYGQEVIDYSEELINKILEEVRGEINNV